MSDIDLGRVRQHAALQPRAELVALAGRVSSVEEARDRVSNGISLIFARFSFQSVSMTPVSGISVLIRKPWSCRSS